MGLKLDFSIGESGNIEGTTILRTRGWIFAIIWFLGVVIQGPGQMERVVGTSPPLPPQVGNSV